MTWSVYYNDHSSELQINRSERDLRSCEVAWSSYKKSPEKILSSNGIRTHDIRNTGAMLYRLSYEASTGAGQVRVELAPQHRTGTADVMGSNTIGAQTFFWASFVAAQVTS